MTEGELAEKGMEEKEEIKLDEEDDEGTAVARSIEGIPEGLFLSMFLMPDMKDVVMIPQVG